MHFMEDKKDQWIQVYLSNKPADVSTICNTQVNVKKNKLQEYAVAGRPHHILRMYFTIYYGFPGDYYVADLAALEPKNVI